MDERTTCHHARSIRRRSLPHPIAESMTSPIQRPLSPHVEKQHMHGNTSSAREEGQPRPRILLVENHDLLRRIIADILSKQAHVATSASADEAIEKARTQSFDLLILDISLGPEKDGIDVLNTLRRDPQYQTTPMIACTAIVAMGYEKRLLDAGFDAYLPKPFEPAELQQLIDDLIAARQ